MLFLSGGLECLIKMGKGLFKLQLSILLNCQKIFQIFDTDIAIIEKVMNAEKDEDCSWIVWKNCDYVLDRIRTISKKIRNE